MLTLIGGLDRSRFRPTLVVLDGNGPLRGMLAADIPVVELGRRRLRGALAPLLKTLRELRPACVVSTMGYLNLGVLMLRRFLPSATRVIVREANAPEATLGASGWPRLVRLLYRRCYPKADLVLCPSAAIRRELCEVYSVPAERLALLENPVDVEGIRRSAAKVERHPGPGPRFVAAGRLTMQKAFDRLLDMMAKLPADAHLTILGDGTERDALLRRTEDLRLGRNVTFAGFVDTPWPWYAGADAFLLPSRWEGMPNAALEALACGTPIIATPEAGGLNEVAARMPSGAVTLAPAGEAFIAAMQAVPIDPTPAPRPNLLPEDFALDHAVARFESLLLKT